MSEADVATARGAALRRIKRSLAVLLYLGVAVCASGCVPIGVRVQNMFS